MYTVRIFMKCTHVFAAQITYLFFTMLNVEPDFPCSADEIAEPRPDMNIKVAALIVSEKTINRVDISGTDEIERYFILIFRQYNYYHRATTVGEEFNTNICIHSQSVSLGPSSSLCLYAYQGMW